MANRKHLLHVKSNVTTTTTVEDQTITLPKLPQASDMEYGEIAINYKDGYETISIKNDNSEIVTFPNTNAVSTMIENAMESVQDELTFDQTPTENSENPVTSGGIKEYVDEAVTIQEITNYADSTPLAVGDTHDQALSKLNRIIEDNELTIARALSELNEKVDSGIMEFDDVPTESSENPVTSDGIKTYVDDSVKIQELTDYEESTPLAVGDTHDEAISKLNKIIEDNEFAVSFALNELNTTKQDTLEFDQMPTENSDNILTSGAIYSALQTQGTKYAMLEYNSIDATTNVINVVAAILNNCESIDEALYIGISRVGGVSPNHGLDASDGTEIFYKIESVINFVGMTPVTNYVYSNGSEILKYSRSGISLKDNGTTGTWYYGIGEAIANKIEYYDIDRDAEVLPILTAYMQNGTISDQSAFNNACEYLLDFMNKHGNGYGYPNNVIFRLNGNIVIKAYHEGSLWTDVENRQNACDMDMDWVNVVDNQIIHINLIRDNDNGDWRFGLTTQTKTILTEHQSLASYANAIEYDSTNKLIYLKNGSTRLSGPIDATDFIKDGMVNNVTVGNGTGDNASTTCLLISFNTDAGQDTIELPIEDIFDADNYYTKEQIGEKEAVTARALIDLEERKMNNVEIDNEPTDESTNLVTSGGVKAYVDDATEAMFVNFTVYYNYLPGPNNETNEYTSCTCDTTLSDIIGAITSNRLVYGKVTYNVSGVNTSTEGSEKYDLTVADKIFPILHTNSVKVNRLDTNGVIFNGVTTTPLTQANSTDAIYSIVSVDYRIDRLGDTLTWREQVVGEGQQIVQEITEYSESTPIEVGDTHDEAFSKLIKIINDDEYITATALSEMDATVDGLGDSINSINSALNELSIETMVEITYDELVDLRDDGELVPGTWYRITDYVTTTTQTNTQSANNAFDVIVLALDVNKLSADAKAIAHEGSNYFNNSKLEAWELKYCLDNNKTRFAWADTQDGTGVIYYMKDEWGNECPYDFKNIMFKRKLTDGQLDATNGSDTWVYTFNAIMGNGAATDNSLGLNLSLLGGSGIITLCADNIIKPCYDYKNINNVVGGSGEYVLNDTVFLGYAATVADVANLYTTGNEFGVCARDNTFGYLIRSNKFGAYCENNTFAYYCYGNRIENNFTENQVSNSFNGNTIGNECQYNTFGSFTEYNTIGNNCQYNTFSTNDMTIDGEDSMVTNATFGNNMSHCTFSSIGGCSIGNYVRWVVMDDHIYANFAIENNVSYVRFTCSASQTFEHRCQNFKICEGVQGTSSSSLKTITHTTVDDTFLTEYKPINSQVISV